MIQPVSAREQGGTMAYISDHAVLRYLERVKGVDIDAIRAEMDCPALDVAAAIGCDTVKRGDGSRLKMVGDTVTTVLGRRMNSGHVSRIMLGEDGA